MRGWTVIAGLFVLVAVSCGPRDTTPPTVVSVTPASGAAEVRLDRAFEVVFSEPLAHASFTPDNVAFEAGGVELEVAVERGADDRTMRIRPVEQPAELPVTATVRLLGTITDRAGNPLEPYSWSFELADWIPLGGVLNRNPEEDVHALSLVWMDGPVLAWSEQVGNAPKVFAARWNEEAGRWEALGDEVGGSRGDVGSMPNLAVYGDRLHAVWKAVVGSDHRSFHAYWDGQAWQNTAEALNHAARNAQFPIAAAGDRLWAAWYEYDTTPTYYGVFSTYDGSGWQDGSPDWCPSGPRCKPTDLLARGSEAWLAYDLESGDAYVVRFDGSGWNPLGGGFDADASSQTHSYGVRLTRTPEGELVALWYELNHSHAAVWDGAQWQVLGTTVTRGTGASAGDVAASEHGLFAAVQEIYLGARLYVRRWDETGGRWNDLGRELVYVKLQGAFFGDVKMALDGEGWPVVAWTVDDGSAWHLYASRYNHVQ